MVYGGDVGYKQLVRFFDMDGAATVGLQARVDDIYARLAPQVKRAPLGTTVDSTIVEASYAPFLKLELQPTPWLRLAGGVRTEVFTFDVRNRCATCAEQPAGNTSSGLVLPKMNVILGPWFRTEFLPITGRATTVMTPAQRLPKPPLPWPKREITKSAFARSRGGLTGSNSSRPCGRWT